MYFCKMKHTIIIIVLSLMLKPVLPVFSYILNYDYIVKELCVNKEKPELHCNGKCHLKKELAKSAESEKPLSQKKQLEPEQQLVFLEQAHVYPDLSGGILVKVKNGIHYSNLYSGLYQSSCFHPPTV